VRDHRYLEISQLTKSFGSSVVVEGFDLAIKKGEIVSLIGHSGCGKSTVLSIVAGLVQASRGGVILDGREVREPGPDRGVVFQAPCLLPWLTAFENVLLGVEQAHPRMPRRRCALIVEHHLRLVGLAEDMHKRPSELSQGMRQRVGIARAFALDPKVLLLDEPFGMLDSLTRIELQQVLIDLWVHAAGQGGAKTALLVTHDVDEALFLSDRIAMMTSGPAARLGAVLDVPLRRPRDRGTLVRDPRYRALREALLGFLDGETSQPAPAAREDVAVLGGRPPARLEATGV
jgi:nitrate/nitrite transport system ATP-binding protein